MGARFEELKLGDSFLRQADGQTDGKRSYDRKSDHAGRAV
jgi:hypothetical protein